MDLEHEMATQKTTGEQTSRRTRKTDKNKRKNIQVALYQIADAASAVTDMQEFYAALHHIVGKLMYAKSFYVTLYDASTGVLSSPYFADEAGDDPPPPTRIDSTNKSLRAYVLLMGKTLHVSAAEIEDGKRRGTFEPMGTPAEDWIGVPLKMNGQTIGSLTVQSYKKGLRYEEHDVQLLEFVAQHIAVALARARAIDETRQRNAELQIINSVQEGLASKLDMGAIYELVGEKIRVTFNAQVVSIDTVEHAAQVLHSRYYFEGGETLPAAPYPIFGFRKHVIENRQPMVINNDMGRWMQEYDNPVNIGLQPKSAIFVPMIAGDEAMGVISLQNNDLENVFSDADLRLLTTLANSMTVALENARLFDETQQRNAELSIINSVQDGLASKLAIQDIYDLVGDRLRDVFHNMDVEIRIYDAKTNIVHNPYTYENGKRIAIRSYSLPERGFAAHVLRTPENLVVNENLAQEMEKYGSRIFTGTQMAKSLMMVPLVVNSHAHGLITISNMHHERAFKESDIRLLQTLANSMSVALENARLWEEEKKYRRALERELEIGREIQAGFLPERLPQVEGWEIAASLMSAREVAGDFYDAFELPDGTIGLVIADVCDKGVGAALFMTLFRSLIRATANLEYFEHSESAISPRSAPERLKRAMSLTNNYITETHGDSGMFATLFFGILDPQSGKLTYINGGHEPPLIVRSGVVHETLDKTGPAVGVVMDCHFDLLETLLNPGDTFFAFTDGVPDCSNPRGDFFGRERLLEILLRFDGSAPELVSVIETALCQYIDGATQFDDITLLAVRRLGT